MEIVEELSKEQGKNFRTDALQVSEKIMREDKMWVEEGQTITLTKEEGKEGGTVWMINCPQGGKMNMILNRFEGCDWMGDTILEEGFFEEGGLWKEIWFKIKGKEVWSKGWEFVILLDTDKALVWKYKWFVSTGECEGASTQVVRTRRVEG